MKFIDRAKIFVKSGQGGNGAVSFRKEKGIPMGGPDGGDGGDGGSIIFVVDENTETLVDFSAKVHFVAKDGQKGSGANSSGKKGEDLIINIPLGTQIYNEDKTLLYYDAKNLNDRFVLFKGGIGGIGNAKFVTSTNRAPRKALPGGESEESWICLVLKMFCDFGYVGFPNAGKSSLLKALTNSNTKIANYPFTTIKPELGALWKHDQKLLMADLPGLIQGASENKGLGFKFLGHVERCSGIVHIIDVSMLNSCAALDAILYEIKTYSEDILKKEQIVVLNKIDLISESELASEIESISKSYDFKVFPISCKERRGIGELVEYLFKVKFKNQVVD